MFNKWADGVNKGCYFGNVDLNWYCIKVDGEIIRTYNGKSYWKKIGHAKSALRNMMQGISRKHRQDLRSRGNISYEELDRIVEEAYQKFLTDRVKFVKITGTEVKE